jgi:hypothetical protein
LQEEFMSKVHLIGGEKGGVGKSLVSRLLAQYFIDRELPFKGYDSDKSHGALLRFYTDFAQPVVVDSYAALDAVIEAAAESPGDRVLVDLAAQTHSFLTRWMNDSGLLDLAGDMGLSIVYWHVMDSGRDSVDLLRKLLDQFGDRMQLVVVLNEVRGDQFDILKASGELERAERLGATVIYIRKLQDGTMQKIDAHSSSFWAATQQTEKAATGLGMLERQRVKIWLNKVYEQFDQLGA